MNNILEDAASRLSMDAADVDALVAGGLARGRRLRRRRQALAGVGSIAAVAVLASGSVWAAHSFGSSTQAIAPAGSSPPSASPTPSTGPIPPSALSTGTLYTADPDAPLTKDADQIHAAFVGLLPAGTVGPILTQPPYPKVSQGTTRIEHFTYDGALVSFMIYAAKGSETCESIASHAVAAAGFGTCQTVGDSTVLTEQSSQFGKLNSVIAWHHGYEISVLSYNSGPTGKANPAMDGKKVAVVSPEPPLTLEQLQQIVTSDIWFQ